MADASVKASARRRAAFPSRLNLADQVLPVTFEYALNQAIDGKLDLSMIQRGSLGSAAIYARATVAQMKIGDVRIGGWVEYHRFNLPIMGTV